MIFLVTEVCYDNFMHYRSLSEYAPYKMSLCSPRPFYITVATIVVQLNKIPM